MERTIDRGAVALALSESGTGARAVLGMHGLTASRRYVMMGSKLVERSERRVVVYDARGHGQSAPAPDADYSYEALAADALAVLDGVGIERALLAGVSMGAHTAVALALAVPERVSGLLLVTPAYDPDEDGSASLPTWDALAAGLRSGGIDGFVAAFGIERLPSSWREMVEVAIRQRMSLHEHPQAVADALSAVPRSRPFASWAQLAAIAVPCAVVGSRDEADPQHPLAVARRYAQAIPGASLHVEEEGQAPLAWQGARLGRLLLDL